MSLIERSRSSRLNSLTAALASESASTTTTTTRATTRTASRVADDNDDDNDDSRRASRDGDGDGDGADDGAQLKDPRHLLLSANTDPLEESGPGYLYNWEDDEWIQLAAGESVSHMSHDIQWQERKKDDENDAIWRPTSSGFDLQDAKTGEYLETYVAPPSYLNDVNHAQILGYDGPYAILNSRVTNSFSKYDMRTGEIVWTCGGDRGGFDFVDIDGTRRHRVLSRFDAAPRDCGGYSRLCCETGVEGKRCEPGRDVVS